MKGRIFRLFSTFNQNRTQSTVIVSSVQTIQNPEPWQNALKFFQLYNESLQCLALKTKWEWKWRVISVSICVCVSLFGAGVELCTATRKQFRCDDFNSAKIPYIPFQKWHGTELQMVNRNMLASIEWLHGKRFCLFVSVFTKYVNRNIDENNSSMKYLSQLAVCISKTIWHGYAATISLRTKSNWLRLSNT